MQLTREERYQVYVLKKAGHKQNEIAHLLKRSASTLNRALNRNADGKGYRPKQAHRKAVEPHTMNARCINEETWRYAQQRLLEELKCLFRIPDIRSRAFDAHGKQPPWPDCRILPCCKTNADALWFYHRTRGCNSDWNSV